MRNPRPLRLLVSLLFITKVSMATEEAPYILVESDGAIEIRDYAPQIVAETTVNASQEDAGNIAFRKLFKYISGNNSGDSKIAMTSPVGQTAPTKRIEIASPLTQREDTHRWIVSFMMPTKETMDTLPIPKDTDIRLRGIPSRRMVAIRYSGRWSSKKYDQHRRQLETWIKTRGIETDGAAEWARYNPPFMPPFMRRNEVLFPIKTNNRE